MLNYVVGIFLIICALVIFASWTTAAILSMGFLQGLWLAITGTCA